MRKCLVWPSSEPVVHIISSHESYKAEYKYNKDACQQDRLKGVTPGSSNTIANLLSCCKDLNKGVNTKELHILLPDHLFSNITNIHLQKTFLEDNEQMRWEILREIHDSQAGGHPGIANTCYVWTSHIVQIQWAPKPLQCLAIFN